jgi:hypothetical protein
MTTPTLDLATARALADHLCAQRRVVRLDLDALPHVLELAGDLDPTGTLRGLLRPEVLAGAIEAVPLAGLSLGPVILVRPGLDPTAYACVTVHELTHSAQVRAAGLLRYARLYVTQGEFRAAQETGAYLAECEVRHYLTGVVPSPEAAVRIESGYLLPAEQVTFGRLLGAQSLAALRDGLYTQPLACDARAWLRARGWP